MVTVAKSLDVPIKLVFPRPPPADDPTAKAGHAMLGLGDVVLPGIMIGLALRFDLFLFYLRRQKHKKAPASSAVATADAAVEKPKYFSLSGRWSDHFWTHSLLTGRPLFKASSSSASSPTATQESAKLEAPFTFPKTYFRASLVGYVAGMLCTLGVMHVWGHAQPALLYLVPGVLGSLWLTALARGELGAMWEFSEAVEDDEEAAAEQQQKGKQNADDAGDDQESNKTKAGPERSSFFSLSDKKAQEREGRARKALSKHVRVDGDGHEDDESGSDDSSAAQRRRRRRQRRSKSTSDEREFLTLSISAPWKLKTPSKASKDKGKGDDGEDKGDRKSNWAPSASSKTLQDGDSHSKGTATAVGKQGDEAEGPPAGKRVRLRK